MESVMFSIATIIIGLVFYFVPTSIAFFTHKRNTLSIFLLNFFLGWTFIGWVIALIWSCSVERN